MVWLKRVWSLIVDFEEWIERLIASRIEQNTVKENERKKC